MTRRSVTITNGSAATYHVKLNSGRSIWVSALTHVCPFSASLSQRPVEGFGGAFTAASGVNYKKLSDEDKRKFIEL